MGTLDLASCSHRPRHGYQLGNGIHIASRSLRSRRNLESGLPHARVISHIDFTLAQLQPLIALAFELAQRIRGRRSIQKYRHGLIAWRFRKRIGCQHLRQLLGPAQQYPTGLPA